MKLYSADCNNLNNRRFPFVYGKLLYCYPSLTKLRLVRGHGRLVLAMFSTGQSSVLYQSRE